MSFLSKIEKGLMYFINKTPNAYFCVNNIKGMLLKLGFVELYENENWINLSKDGKYFVCKNDSSLIAFKMCDVYKNTGFNIVSTHADSPCFSVKTNASMFENGYVKLNTNSYGRVVYYSWLDRPLSIAGRIITLRNGLYERKLVNIDKDLLVIPSQAIHLNEQVNDKNKLNPQVDMLPIMSLDKNVKLEDVINKHFISEEITVDKIIDYDLYLYNREEARIIGANDEFILSPRLDDLASVYSSFLGFIHSSNSDSINVFGVFNKEEIGSLSEEGAGSTFLRDILKRISKSFDFDLSIALANSIQVCADNDHAVHPNAREKSDVTNIVELNKGIIIKHHINYTTDALSSSLIKELCNKKQIPYQDFVCRADMDSGSTLGGVSEAHVSVNSVDLGIPQLAMHSSCELIGSKDVFFLYKTVLEFYNSTFIKQKNTIKYNNSNDT